MYQLVSYEVCLVWRCPRGRPGHRPRPPGCPIARGVCGARSQLFFWCSCSSAPAAPASAKRAQPSPSCGGSGACPAPGRGARSSSEAARARGRRARRRRGCRARTPAGSCSAGRARPLAPRLASARAERRVGEDKRANAGREEVLEWMGYARAARERPSRMNSVGFTPTRRAQPPRVGALTAEKRGDFSHARRSHGLPTNCGTADTMRVRFTRSTFVFTSVQLGEVCRARPRLGSRGKRISVLEGSP